MWPPSKTPTLARWWAAVGVPKQRLEFTYDVRSRRVAKKVLGWNSAGGLWEPMSEARFLYDGWNVVAEYSFTSSFVLARSYLWGVDLSNSLQGAGGIGGLLAITQHTNASGAPLTIPASVLPAYDGSGNVRSYHAATSGLEEAAFAYGPFGEVLAVTGPGASKYHFRFSSKWQDDETMLNYYGFRYYNPKTGRWLSRDPLGERGGCNLYGFVNNDPLSWIDPDGRAVIAAPVVYTAEELALLTLAVYAAWLASSDAQRSENALSELQRRIAEANGSRSIPIWQPVTMDSDNADTKIKDITRVSTTSPEKDDPDEPCFLDPKCLRPMIRGFFVYTCLYHCPKSGAQGITIFTVEIDECSPMVPRSMLQDVVFPRFR